MNTLTTKIAGLALCFGLVAGAYPAVAAGGGGGSSTPRITELTQAQAA
ncbi:MAG: hypothetical protein HYZ04_05225, partial [Rhodospirillales bacterium]|nr:hypothetical protein [Rhodospirillales bacterium]